MKLFEERCREAGLALTVQRRAVYEVVLSREDHPTADQVYDDARAKFPDISRTTVYRVLDTLAQIGVIGKPSYFGSATRYEPNTHRHHHLICVRCGKVLDLDDDGVPLQLQSLLSEKSSGFDVLDYSIHFHGVCTVCRNPGTSGERQGS